MNKLNVSNSGELADNTYLIPIMLTKEALLDELEEIINLTEDRPSSEKMKYTDVQTYFIGYRMLGVFEHMFFHLADNLKLLCDFNEPTGIECCDRFIEELNKLETDGDYFPQSMIETVNEIKNRVLKRNSNNS